MIIHTASGKDTVIDYRERAPESATRDMYVGTDGKVIKGEGSSVLGWKAGGVPGTVAGFYLAFLEYCSGELKWTDLVEPAYELASEGFTVTQELAALLKQNEGLRREIERLRLQTVQAEETARENARLRQLLQCR